MINPYSNYNYNYMPQQATNSLIRVTGLEGAKAYQMPANSTVALFDCSEDVMYIKSTDGAGFPTIRTFEFSEKKSVVNTTENYVTRSEFEELKQEVINYGKQLISNANSTNSTQYTAGSNDKANAQSKGDVSRADGQKHMPATRNER